MENVKTYVIHVSDDDVRAEHVTKELKDKISAYEFINEGDIADLNEDIVHRYFHESLHDMKKPNEISCAYKHLRAYEKLLHSGDEMCLILEDDVILYPNFLTEMSRIFAEVKSRKLRNFIVSLEDSTNQFLKGSEKVKGQLLYAKQRGRLAGAYLIDKEAARNFLDFVLKRKCDRGIDNFQTVAAKAGIFTFYWCKNAVATQGSKNGLLPSHIAKVRTGFLRKTGVKVHRLYKKMLYEFR